MASTSLRDSISSLGWSRRDQDIPVNTNSSSTPILSRFQSLNPFGQRGYVSLPTHEGPGAPLPAPTRREEEEGWYALSRWDRLLIFGGLNITAAIMFTICFILVPTPVFVLKPRKFAVLWTLGSVFFLASWAVIMGPIVYVSHLTSGPRLPFTAAYLGSITLTLYFSVGRQNTIMTFVCALAQMVALLWYLISYFPMGTTGLRFASQFAGNRMAAWMRD